MNSHAKGSVSLWIDELKEGDSLAAQQLWDRYFGRLIGVAEARLRSLSRDVEGEDVALSAMKSVMIGVQNDRFPNLTDRTGLWPLLVTITARKSISEVRRQLAGKRGAGMSNSLEGFMALLSEEPSPDFAAEVADEMERLVRIFDDSALQTIAQRKLEGCSNEEIAEELGCSVRTVIRKLNRIRQEWDECSSDNRADSGRHHERESPDGQ